MISAPPWLPGWVALLGVLSTRRTSRFALLAVLAVAGARAAADPFEVTTTADSPFTVVGVWDANPGDGICADTAGTCTLRAAVQEANQRPGPDVVRLPPGHYLLSSSALGGAATTLFIEESSLLTIEGSGAASTIIDVGGRGTVIGGYGGGTLVVTDLTITGGGLSGGAVLFYSGGGIGYFGFLELKRVSVLGNVGGGLSALGGSVVDSLVAGNSGVGSIVSMSYPLVVNSTISTNTSWGQFVCAPPGYAPGCWCEFPPVAVSGRILFSTIADNQVDLSRCAGMPLGVDPPHAATGRFFASVISNPGLMNCNGWQESQGQNLDSDGSCGLTLPTDLSGVDPMLGPLHDNGGPTPTHALLAGSPAIDAIPPLECTYDDDDVPGTPDAPLLTDQRGVRRPHGGRCDIGAYERGCGLGAELAILLPLVMRRRRRSLGKVAVLVLALLSSAPSRAATFEVDGTADTSDASPGDGVCADASGACTFRAALREANANGSADVISLPTGSFVLPAPTPPPPFGEPSENPVIEELTLTGVGAGATTLSGSLQVLAPTVQIGQLEIQGPVNGTAIASVGNLELYGVLVTGAQTGIDAGGSVRIERSSIVGNDLAIHVAGEPVPPPDRGCYPAALEVANTTVSGDRGISLWCVGANLSNATVATSAGTALSNGGGHTAVSLKNSILYAEVEPACSVESWRMLSGGHNLDSDGTCGLTDPTDLSGVDPMLGPLQNDGAPTPTHALLTGSPAIDAIPVARCTYDDDGDPGTPEVPLATDQRGVRRPHNGRCDIGAYERGCGLGAELAVLLPLLGSVRRRKG